MKREVGVSRPFSVESTEVRKASPEDVISICAIQTECDLSPWPREAYELEVKRDDAITLIASHTTDGAPEGFITGRVIPGGADSSVHAEIYNIGVYRATQSRGVGSALLKEFIGICSDFGVSRIFLEVRQSNLRAIGFYQSHGFVKVGERKDFYADPVENAEIMARAIDDRDSR